MEDHRVVPTRFDQVVKVGNDAIASAHELVQLVGSDECANLRLQLIAAQAPENSVGERGG
jgi:hypothetical protein